MLLNDFGNVRTDLDTKKRVAQVTDVSAIFCAQECARLGIDLNKASIALDCMQEQS